MIVALMGGGHFAEFITLLVLCQESLASKATIMCTFDMEEDVKAGGG